MDRSESFEMIFLQFFWKGKNSVGFWAAKSSRARSIRSVQTLRLTISSCLHIASRRVASLDTGLTPMIYWAGRRG